jgi:hypothetical protein
MFYGSIPADDPVKLPEVPVPVFITLLRYFYCKEIIIEKAFIVETAFAADMYDIPDLSFAVGALLKPKSLTLVANAIADTPSHTHLKQQVVDNILNRTPAYFVTNNFYNLSLDAMDMVIEVISHRKLVTPDQAADVWNGIVNWVHNQYEERGITDRETAPTKLKQVMKSLVDKFPFSRMTPEQFVSGPEASGLLPPNVVIDYYHKYYAKTTEKESSFKRMKLS